MKEKKLTGYASVDLPQSKNATYFEKKPIIPNVDIYTLLKITSMPNLQKTAVDCDDLRVSYKKFLKDIKNISNAMKELGIKSNDIVAVSMPNYYQALLIYFAANRLGATVTYLNYFSPKEETVAYLNQFESPILINYDKSKEYNEYVKKESKVKYIISLLKSNINNIDFQGNIYLSNNNYNINYNGLESIAIQGKKSIEPVHSKKTNSLILFTSGTTGKPKSVVLTNENVIAAQMYMMNTSHTSKLPVNKVITCVPFSYPYGLCTSAVASVLWGKETILAPYISKDTIPYYYSKGPNMVMGSPALLDLTIKYVPKEQDLSSVKYFISGGDFLTVAHAKRGKDFFEYHGAKNIELGNGFGNAETVSIGSTPFGLQIKPETAGKVLVGSTCMIIDPETGEEKKYNEEGLIYVNGKHVFKEYYKNPDLTAEVKQIINGKEYFNTGTMGKIDEEGYLTITGRESRFYIISSLNKVYCDNVQSKLSTIDSIYDVAVVKVPNDELLYVNKAYIVPNDKNKDLEELEKEIRDKFSSTGLKEYEYPVYIEFVDNLPRKKGTDKIDYDCLEKDAIKELNRQKKLILK